MVMVWEDLTVELPGSFGAHNKKLLSGITGFAEPARIMAVMGPSGCGKTTFLDSFTGKLPANVVVTGNILINGKKTSLYSREVPTSSNSTLGMRTSEIRRTLIESYKSSKLMINARRRIQQLKPNEEQEIKPNIGGSTTWSKQLCTLTKRSFLNMTRDIGYYWLRIIFYTLVGISIGTLFFHIGTGNNSILARGKCVSFIYGFMICLSCGGLPFFIEELKVFYVERSKGHYGEAAFVVSNIISSFPFLVLLSLSSGIIIYFMVQFHPGLSNCAFFCINLFCCLSVAECCIMVVASVVPNVLMGIGTGVGVIIFMMMPSQIFRSLPDIPKFFWRYPMSYLSFAAWAAQGQYKNDMLGVEFDPLVPGDPKVSGEKVLALVFGVPLDHGKWWDLTALVTLLLVHRVVLYLVLRFVKRAKSPKLWLYAQKSLHFAERCLLNNKPSIFSWKQAQHPLSSKEGVMSPNLAI
ncbi:ABC transporter G family member 15 [Spatholobus suberectus]|nr:ABC transporter G family member 15 [Spatholobus suberectus]